MSHPARLSLRAPPHLPFIQGWPGIPPTEGGKRVAAGISGTVEVRVGAQAVKAKWLRVELRRHEQLPPGFPSTQPTWEHVGEINTLWSSSQGKEYDQLDTSDFRFFLPLPETTPPSVEMMKGSGVRYELVAALCYKRKGGIFKSDSAEIIKVSEPLNIIKHELHSVWPVYNNPDSKAVNAQDVTMTVQRPGVAFGPGDRILLTASIKSSRAIPFKLRGFECTLMEVVTMFARPAKDKKKKAQAGPVVKSRPIAQARCAVDESVGRGGEKSARIDMAVPVENLLVTVRHAKTLEVGYELQVKAVCDGFDGPTVSAIRYVVGLFSRLDAQKTMQMIGHVPALCPFTSPVPSRATSNSGSAPRPQSFAGPTSSPQVHVQAPNGTGLTPFPQGDWRRQSTSTITTTTADRNHTDWLPLPNNRPFSTLPPRHVSPVSYGHPSPHTPQQQQSGLVPFPTASPAPTDKLYRSNSMTMSDYSSAAPDERPVSMQPMSEQGHGGNRQSNATMATFGAWDKGLQRNLQGVEESLTATSSPTSTSTRTMPNPYASPIPFTPPASESEKVRLYDTARQSAAASHRSTGVPLNVVGLDDIPDTAPPEYAPPVPPIPAAVQQERSRPGSMVSPGVASPVLGSPRVDQVGNSPMGSPGLGLGLGYSDKDASQRDEVGSVTEGSGPSSGAAPGPSVQRQSLPRPSNHGSSAISEKEQMRRYFEAKDKVERAARGEVSDGSEEEEGERAGPIGPGIGQGSVSQLAQTSASSPGGADRQDGAADRFNADMQTSHSPQGAGSSRDVGIAPPIPLDQTHPQTPASTSNAIAAATAYAQSPPAGASAPSGPSRQYMSAEQEKDLMRQRYEEATSRANRARSSLGTHEAAPSTSTGFTGSPGPGSPVHPNAPSVITSQIDSAASSPRLSNGPVLTSYTRQGTAAAQGSSSVASLSQPSHVTTPANPASGQGYMSAEQEKDMMRRRFEEAQARVDKAYGRPRVSDASPPVEETIRAGDAAHSAAGSRSAVETEQTSMMNGGTAQSASVYPSAEQEKEAMRRRYEQASSRVFSGASAVGGGADGNGRADVGGSAGGGSDRPLPPARPLSVQPPNRSGSVIQEPGHANGYDTQQIPAPKLNGGTVTTPASTSEPAGGQAPPPPLPARPPAEYINLLSPSVAPNKRYSFA